MKRDVLDTNREVRVSNRIIRAHYALSPIQNRLVRMVAAQVSIADTDFKEYEFDRKDLVRALGLEGNGRRYEVLRKLTRSMVSQEIEYLEADEEHTKFIQTAWFSACEYEGNSVRISFSPKLKPYYIDIQKAGNYTRYPFKTISPLNGKYSIRFYEIFRSEAYKCVEGKWFVDLSLADISDYFELPKKLRPSDIKRDVVDAACREINKETDIDVRVIATKERIKDRLHTTGFHFDCYFKAIARSAKSQEDVDDDESRRLIEGLSAKERARFNDLFEEARQSAQVQPGLFALEAYTVEAIAMDEALRKMGLRA